MMFKLYWGISLGPSSILPPGILTELWNRLKLVTIPRLVKLDDTDYFFPILGRTWLDADNLWVRVYPQIMKTNAGDHACPGNVGMQRTERDQIGISHAVKVKFTYGPIWVARKKNNTHIRTGTEKAHKQHRYCLLSMCLAWINMRERRYRLCWLFNKKILLFLEPSK